MAAMTADEVEALVLACSIGQEFRSEEFGAILTYRPLSRLGYGGAYEVGRRRVRPLVLAGAVQRTRPAHYIITEKGRIAAALLMAKDTALRAAFFDDNKTLAA